jgi:hypothetical protein
LAKEEKYTDYDLIYMFDIERTKRSLLQKFVMILRNLSLNLKEEDIEKQIKLWVLVI